MKNTNPSGITTCITLTNREFEEAVKTIWGNEFSPDYCGDRVGITAPSRDIPRSEMFEKLRNHFDVHEVISAFFLSDRPRSVWIEYAEVAR